MFFITCNYTNTNMNANTDSVTTDSRTHLESTVLHYGDYVMDTEQNLDITPPDDTMADDL